MGLRWREKQARIPKLEGTSDKGAPLPKPASGYEYRRTGTQPNGWPIVEAVKKPDYE